MLKLQDILNWIKNRLTALENSIPQVDAGTASVTVPANSSGDVKVTYNKTFKTAPVVTAGLRNESTTGTLGSASIEAINLTTAGCTIRAYNASSVSFKMYIRWIAITTN